MPVGGLLTRRYRKNLLFRCRLPELCLEEATKVKKETFMLLVDRGE